MSVSPSSGSSEGWSPGSWAGNAMGKEVFEKIMGTVCQGCCGRQSQLRSADCSWGLCFLLHPPIYFPLFTLQKAASATLNPWQGGGWVWQGSLQAGSQRTRLCGIGEQRIPGRPGRPGPWGMRPWWPWGRGACREWEAELESDPRVVAGVHSFTHRSFIHSFTPSFTHSFPPSLIPPPTHSFINSLSLLLHSAIHHSLTHWAMPSLTHSRPTLIGSRSFTPSLIHSFIHPLAHPALIHSFICWSIHSISLY